MFKHFIKLEWKSFLRSSSFGSNLALKIIMGIFAFFIILEFLALGIFSYDIMEDYNLKPLETVNKYLIYYVFIDLIIRYFLQKMPVTNIKPLLLLPITITQLGGNKVAGESAMGDFVISLNQYLAHGQPVYLALYGLGIIFFCFFYTAVVFNPEETSENLKKAGGFIPGIRPGKNTESYLDYVLTRITVLGAAYLTLVCLLPDYVMAQTGQQQFFAIGGTSLLILVNVTIDTISQIQSHLLAHQYGDLLKKAKLKGGRAR